MIKIQLYNHSSNLGPHLNHTLEECEKVTIITPNPDYADIARTKFAHVHQNIEAITIAKFLKDELNELLSDELINNYKGKSDLNLLLGSLWKIKKEEGHYELFKRCFQILTDLRSFTLNSDILHTILENYDQEISEGVLWFHTLLEQMNIVDEHRSYFMLSQTLREGDLPPTYENDRTLIFWGFDFLTGSQVDLLNALSIRNDVLLPFPKLTFDQAKDLDWIKWLAQFDATVDEIDLALPNKTALTTFTFPKNYLGTCLVNLKKNQFKNQTLDIVLGAKNLADDDVSQVPFGNHTYKIATDIFRVKLDYLSDILKEQMRLAKIMTDQQILSIATNFAKESIEKQDYRALKATSVFIETLNHWVDLSEQNEKLKIFDLKIILDSTRLNLPRNSVFSSPVGVMSVGTYPIRSLKTLEQQNHADMRVLCVTSLFDPIKSSSMPYSENVEKYLASIGPVRRSELEFLILKSKITELLQQQNSVLLIEDGIIEHDQGWSHILNEFHLNHQVIELSSDAVKNYYPLKSTGNYPLKSISASKLQMYLDCPRKFYLTYVLKQRPRIELTSELNYMQLGLIEHAVIEIYLKRNSVFDENLLDEVIVKVLNEFEEKGELLPEKKEEYWLEVKSLCSSVIEELLVMNKHWGLNLEFEKAVPQASELEVKGSIDCYGFNDKTIVILDFKRGSGSIPSQVKLKEFQKIQLWFYLDKLKKAGALDEKKNIVWGYINLSNLDKSLIYCTEDASLEIFKTLNLKMFKNVYHLDEDMTQLLEKYSTFETETIEKIKNDRQYITKPFDIKACQYCELSNVCQRSTGEINVCS